MVGLVVTNMLCPGLVVVLDSLPGDLGSDLGSCCLMALESLFCLT